MSSTLFFYGVLIHPKILRRVINNDASHPQFCPAILKDYTRHKVKFEDYPGILPCERSKALLGRELTPEENCVRGTLVAGLTEEDLRLLDVFEGDEYVRLQLTVHPLGSFMPFSTDAAASSEAVEDSLTPAGLPTIPSAGELGQPIQAETYVWCRDSSTLEKELWSFDEFVRTNAWKWLDPGPWSNEHYGEVDRVKERS